MQRMPLEVAVVQQPNQEPVAVAASSDGSSDNGDAAHAVGGSVGPAACSDGSSDNGDAAHAVGGSVGPANELPGEEVVRKSGVTCLDYPERKSGVT